MSIQLVIAEKPSVARSIAGVIGADQKRDGYMEGNGYLVSWCIGHLVSLADAGAYDERFKKWRYDDLPILPQEWQYIIPAEKKGQFAVLRSLMERPDVTGLVCATDAGREGELIFRFVYQMAGCKKPFKRLWISSMEDAAIREGFAHLKPGADYDDLYQSALCRAQADWLVGINATRLFSILYHKTLTVGRVQTPTLNMLVDREAKISNFKKEKYHVVHIAAGGMEAASDRFMNPDDADATKTACAGAQAVCVSVKREKKTEQPPRLYDLTTLQREANRLFGFTAKQTLDYAQQLYEKKLLTYPRTDSQYLTDDMQPTAESIVSGLWPLLSFAAGLDIAPQFGRVLNSKKVSDHHAIIPTMEFVQKGFDGLTEGDIFAIYQIKGGPETRDYRFEAYESLQEAGLAVDRQNYDLVYTAPLGGKTTLEDIYRTFNLDRPADFTGHSLSVSDIVVLTRSGKEEAHYCDSFGFTPVPEFFLQREKQLTPRELLTGECIQTPRGSFLVTDMSREQLEAAGYGFHHQSEDGKYLIMGNGTDAFAIPAQQESPIKAAEMTTEQNYNMIDGVLNNAPTMSELEAKAKAGEQISLFDVAEAAKAEAKKPKQPQRPAQKQKKPSIRAQLKAAKEEQQKKPPQREKTQELEV